MYIGRGDFGETDWSGAHKEAKNNLAPNLTGYLFSKPSIAYFLEKGLHILGYSCEGRYNAINVMVFLENLFPHYIAVMLHS